MGPRSAAACARKHSYEADREGYVRRGKTERKHRRVTLRPAPDTMSFLSGYLPAEQGVACLKALREHTDTAKAAGDPRCRDQIMADTLVERLTGQATAIDVNVELHLVMPIDALLESSDPTAALLDGYGPLPTELARDILLSSKGRSGGAGSTPSHMEDRLSVVIRSRPSVRRVPSEVDHAQGSGVPRPVLRCTDTSH